jgi:DNA-binding transcriptional ArsR family regulator
MLESMRRFKAGMFRALAHPTRVAIVEYLQYGDKTVEQLCEKIGIEQANASQHLAALSKNYIVRTRKDGNQIYYSLRDPLLNKVLEAMREFFLSHLSEALSFLREEQKAIAEQKAEQDTSRPSDDP